MSGKLYTRTYHDFTIDKIYFMGELVATRRNEIIMTCSTLYERKYKQMR